MGITTALKCRVSQVQWRFSHPPAQEVIGFEGHPFGIAQGRPSNSRQRDIPLHTRFGGPQRPRFP